MCHLRPWLLLQLIAMQCKVFITREGLGSGYWLGFDLIFLLPGAGVK